MIQSIRWSLNLLLNSTENSNLRKRFRFWLRTFSWRTVKSWPLKNIRLFSWDSCGNDIPVTGWYSRLYRTSVWIHFVSFGCLSLIWSSLWWFWTRTKALLSLLICTCYACLLLGTPGHMSLAQKWNWCRWDVQKTIQEVWTSGNWNDHLHF